METFIPINLDKVQRLLLTNGWHGVKDGSFLVGNYGFVRGQTEPEGKVLACSLTAVLALGSTALVS